MSDSTSDTSSLDAVWKYLKAAATPLLEVPSHRFDQAFMLLLLVTIGWQLVAAQEFSADGRLFAVVIGTTTFLLLVLLLLSEFSSRVKALMDRLGGDVMTMGSDLDVQSGADDIDERTARTRVLRISAWIGFATFLVWLIGFIPSILLFMLVFYLLETDLGPARSIGYALVIWVVILIVFVELLNIRFYSGVFNVMSLFPYP